jgi:hypothetical protein
MSSESLAEPDDSEKKSSTITINLKLLLPKSSDDYSELEPPLPIPNRTVKRLSADDSVDYPRESRSSSEFLFKASAMCPRLFDDDFSERQHAD